jgi:hypothetical protein
MGSSCPLCCFVNNKLKSFIFQNKVYSSVVLAKHVEIYNLSLVKCSKCSFIFNQRFVH